MPELTLWNSLVPAVVIALVIRLDARLVGPYFAITEVIHGFQGLDADLNYTAPRLKFALIRRFLWPAVVSGLGAVVERPDAHARGVAMGLLATGLLLWPGVFHGLGWGVPRDLARLTVLYMAVAAGFGLSGWFGAEVVQYVRGEIKASGAVEFLRDLALPAIGLWALQALASSSLRELRRKRDEDGADGA